jgi:hypothetical protein
MRGGSQENFPIQDQEQDIEQLLPPQESAPSQRWVSWPDFCEDKLTMSDHGPSIKDDEQYESLQDEGMSKEKAAAIANTENAAKKGGKASPYEDWTVDELHERARELNIEGRSDMNKDELIKALRST